MENKIKKEIFYVKIQNMSDPTSREITVATVCSGDDVNDTNYIMDLSTKIKKNLPEEWVCWSGNEMKNIDLLNLKKRDDLIFLIQSIKEVNTSLRRAIDCLQDSYDSFIKQYQNILKVNSFISNNECLTEITIMRRKLAKSEEIVCALQYISDNDYQH